MPEEMPSETLGAAKAAFRAGRLAECETLSKSLMSDDPNHFEARLLLADVASRTGRSAMALDYLREAVEIDPKDFEAIIKLAALYTSEGQTDAAAELCQKAILIRPDLGSPYFHLGRCYLRARQFDGAVASFQKAISFDPGLATLHHHLGVALQEMGRGREAASCFQKAIKLDPRLAVSYVELGHLCLAEGNLDAAVSHYRRAANLMPNSVNGYLYLGRALVEEHKFEEAEQLLKKVIELDPNHGEAHVLLGRALQQCGRFEDAEHYLKQGLKLDPERGNRYYVTVLGRRMTETDRPLVHQMLKVIEQPHMAESELRLLHYALGKALDDLGEYEPAIRHYDQANVISKRRLMLAGRSFDPERMRASVDRSIAKFSKVYLQKCKGLGADSDRPIFIVGMPRSGTTLLEQIISSHPDVVAAGELGTWTDLASGPFQESDFPPGRADVIQIADRFLRRLEKVSQNSRMVTEKTPQNYMVLGPIAATFPKAHIIHCRRNPVDTCLSIFSTAFKSGPEFAHDREDLKFAYEQYLKMTRHWQAVLPPGYMLEVDYEDLVTNPEPVIGRILDFLGLEWSDECLRHERNEYAISTPSLWQARQPIFNRSVERWRRYEPWLGCLRLLLPEAKLGASGDISL